MGITGDKDRLDATTISDTVNTSSRIESLTKYYKANILLSEHTVSQMENSGSFSLRYLGKVRVKGKQASIGLYECFNSDSEESIYNKNKSLAAFNDGMSHYLNLSFSKAISAFESIKEINKEDLIANLFLNNSVRFLKDGVPENWSCVLEMHNK